MASVQENLDKLMKVWIAEGRTRPLLYPLERVEIFEFARHHGISDEETVEVMRALAEHAESFVREHVVTSGRLT